MRIKLSELKRIIREEVLREQRVTWEDEDDVEALSREGNHLLSFNKQRQYQRQYQKVKEAMEQLCFTFFHATGRENQEYIKKYISEKVTSFIDELDNDS